MTRHVVVVPPSLAVRHAWKIMKERRVRHLPVVTDGQLDGILSDRDLISLGHVGTNGELTFVDRCVGDIMTLAPIVCAPTDSVGHVARTMIAKKIDSLPVISDGRLVGLVTSTDLLELLVEREEPHLPFDFRVELAMA